MTKQCFKVIASTQQLGNRSKRATSEPETAGIPRAAKREQGTEVCSRLTFALLATNREHTSVPRSRASTPSLHAKSGAP